MINISTVPSNLECGGIVLFSWLPEVCTSQQLKTANLKLQPYSEWRICSVPKLHINSSTRTSDPLVAFWLRVSSTQFVKLSAVVSIHLPLSVVFKDINCNSIPLRHQHCTVHMVLQASLEQFWMSRYHSPYACHCGSSSGRITVTFPLTYWSQDVQLLESCDGDAKQLFATLVALKCGYLLSSLITNKELLHTPRSRAYPTVPHKTYISLYDATIFRDCLMTLFTLQWIIYCISLYCS